jgi:regulatory protein
MEMNKAEFDKAWKSAVTFIKYRPRSIKEVKDKLKTKEYSDHLINKVIYELMAGNLLNDEEFARAWVNERFLSKNLGKIKVKNELKLKGIGADIIAYIMDEALSGCNELEMAEKFIERKFKRGYSGIEKEKLIALLLRNGYTYSVAEKVVKGKK